MQASDYKFLVDYAKNAIKRNKSELEPEETVNEAYLRLYDTPYNVDAYKKTILSYVIDECRLANTNSKIIEGDVVKKDVLEDYKVCSDCKEPLPIAAFRQKKNNVGAYVANYNCKACERKYLKGIFRKQQALLADSYLKKIIQDRKRAHKLPTKVTAEEIHEERINQLNNRRLAVIKTVYNNDVAPYMLEHLTKAKNIIDSIRKTA